MPARFPVLAKLLLSVALLTLLFAASVPADEKQLTEVRSPNFRVLTTASDRDGRRVAQEFEQMRAAFAIAFPKMRLTTGAPLLIFAVRDEGEMKGLAPALWKNNKNPMPAGIFQHGWERQFAVVRLDQDSEHYNVVHHEYIHTLLHSNLHWLPHWLDEGLADFYGTTKFEGKKMYIGAPSVRLAVLRNQTFLPLETVLKVNPWSFYRGDHLQINKFYAEAWALVHYLDFGPGMENGAKMSLFIARLQRGDDQRKAFEEVFGSYKDVENALQQYVNNFLMRAYGIEDPHPTQEKDFSARKLSKAESDAEIGGYRLWNHDREEAAELVDRALQQDAALGLAHEEKGMIFFNEGKDQEAEQEFFRAYELDKTRYLAQFFYTMMTAKWDTREHRRDLHMALLQTLAVNPQFAPAYVQLAMQTAAEGQTESALALSRKAEQLEPSRSGYHVLSGEILLRLKRNKEAAEFARYVAERWKGPDHNEAVALWEQIPEADRPADAEVKYEVEEQSQAAEGRIQAVSCEDKNKVEVKLQKGDEVLVFKSKGRQMVGFSDTLWYGEDHFSLCRHIVGMHAVVRYRPPVDTSYAGDWLSIELRDELPQPAQSAAAAAPAGKESPTTAVPATTSNSADEKKN
jgi:hypothetical protein